MGVWRTIRKIWATVGAAVFVIFTTWSLLSYRARPDATAALEGNDRVAVTRGDGFWTFAPAQPAAVGLIFFPGALVAPAAYAPIAQAVAAGGYTVVLVELPRRGAFGGADSPEIFARTDAATRSAAPVARWVVAGHSRGGVVASKLVHQGGRNLAGLVLIGTSHPRDFSLASTPLPVTRVFGTRDTIADVEKLEATRHNLPPSTRFVRIDGGNHSQFGQYGFQPGDWPATIDRATQHRITVDAIFSTLTDSLKRGGVTDLHTNTTAPTS
jgi:pimeloyl-ACP methyl ester carboxylesterase